MGNVVVHRKNLIISERRPYGFGARVPREQLSTVKPRAVRRGVGALNLAHLHSSLIKLVRRNDEPSICDVFRAAAAVAKSRVVQI